MGERPDAGGGRVALRDEWIELDGLRVFCRVSEGRTREACVPMIHVHGFGISGRYLVPTAELLGTDYPTFVPDLPGFGRSQRPRTGLDIPGLAETLARFMDAVGVPEAILIGNSLGCVIILEFANTFPDRVAAAILCSPAGGPRNQSLARAAGQLLRDGLHESLRLKRIAVGDYLGFGVVRALRLFAAMRRYPTMERISTLRVPTLAVIGSLDPFVAKGRSVEVAHMVPGITLVEIVGAPHALNFTHAETLARIVRSFLAGGEIMDDASLPGEVRVLLDDRRV